MPKSERDTVKWGVLGTANIARAAVIPALHAAENSAVTAVASRQPDTAAAFAKANGISTAYGSYEELLQDPAIQAVYIPLPNSLHKTWTIRAVEAGKHVLCEKPLALTADECMEMKAAADKAGVLLMEAFMYRFHPRTEKVREMVATGSIGSLSAIEAAFTFRLTRPDNIRFSPELGGGALMDVGCYCVNVIRTMAGSEPGRVSAYETSAPSGVDGRLTGMMMFDDGVQAHFDCSLTDERRERYLLAGADGFLEVERAFLPGSSDCEIREVRGRDGEKIHTIPGADEYQLMVEHFADCVQTGQTPRYSVEEAAANMRVIELLKRSAAAGGQPMELG